MSRVAILLLVVGVLAATSAADAAAPPVTLTPGQLTVGLSMPSEGFQVGAVRGTQVVLAQGFEIDLARAIAAQLGLTRTVFVQNRFDRLFSLGAKPFDVAIAEITITARRRAAVEFSRSYMIADQGVLVAQTLKRVPRTVAALRPLQLCALAKSTGADLVQSKIRPVKPLRLVGNVPQLLLHLQTGHCEAVVYDAPPLASLKARAPVRYGPFAGVIKTGEKYGIAMPRGSTLLGPVNDALAALIADGTVERLQRKWINVHFADLPVLR